MQAISHALTRTSYILNRIVWTVVSIPFLKKNFVKVDETVHQTSTETFASQSERRLLLYPLLLPILLHDQVVAILDALWLPPNRHALVVIERQVQLRRLGQ